MPNRAHLITKENHARFKALAQEAKARRKAERAQLAALADKLSKTSPAPWLDNLEQQRAAIHQAILRELTRGESCSTAAAVWVARLDALVRVQERLIDQRRKLIGDKEPFPVHESRETAAEPIQAPVPKPSKPQDKPQSDPPPDTGPGEQALVLPNSNASDSPSLDTAAEPIPRPMEPGQDESSEPFPI